MLRCRRKGVVAFNFRRNLMDHEISQLEVLLFAINVSKMVEFGLRNLVGFFMQVYLLSSDTPFGHPLPPQSEIFAG